MNSWNGLGKLKKWIACLLIIASLTGLTACAGSGNGGADNKTDKQQMETESGTRTFTDSAGRTVELPDKITKIAPSGVVAQVMLYTLCPDLLCGLAMDLPYYADDYIDDKYNDLPVFGQLYGSNANLNMEALISAEPDVLIDMGEKKDTIKEDLDAVQEQLGVPVIFIEATLPTMAEAYETLGGLGIEPDQAEKLAAYCKDTMDYAGQQAEAVPEDERKTVYLAMGNDGLTTSVQNSIHADVIETAGGQNVVTADALSGRTGNVSYEQLLMWQPDYILVENHQVYREIKDDELWQELDAVKNGQVYEIPYNPYSFLNSPPSVNRMIGIWWLGHLLYPEQYPDDTADKMKEFYQLFYHTELTEDDCEGILGTN